MNDNNMKSTAGPRQFENTAIAKLRARGVPKHVAEAFVRIGLPKSGRVEAIRDQVCKMKYQKFFIERTSQDFADPLRVGAYVPEVIESKALRFHCEFAMSDIESAAFSKVFPEFDVVAKGRSYNQHAFFANKRYAECELLMQMVHRDAARSGLNPKSVVDLGGNSSWHVKRGRDHVHCDNPVLSARDEMRYVVREVFSGTDRDAICDKRFGTCEVGADYAIGVHATYDIQPKAIAMAMCRRGIKKFYGVLNYIQGIENKHEGVYESDGIVMTLHRPAGQPPYAECGFRHDPSLKYSHKLSTMRRYLSCSQRYDVVVEDGSTVHYTYRIQSMRGPTIVFVIDQSDPGVLINTMPWTDRSKSTYLVSLKFLGVDKLEVDAEFFDRLVLQAASARNIANYDIVALFRYAKSLRQRVSMNGVVLSSGFRYDPEQLMHATIAAYGTAAAYRTESREYFKRATSQIVSIREKGFFRDLFDVSVQALKLVALVLPVALAKAARLDELDRLIKAKVAEGKSITIQLYKPHADSGMVYDPRLFSSKVVVQRAKALYAEGKPITPYSRYYSEATLPTRVKCGGVPVTFFSRGTVAYDSVENPGDMDSLHIRRLCSRKDAAGMSVEKARLFYTRKAMSQLRLSPDVNQVPIILPNADRMYRHGLKSIAEDYGSDAVASHFVSNIKTCVIFRGVGQYAVKLTPPRCYARLQCAAFIMLFEWWEGPEIPLPDGVKGYLEDAGANEGPDEDYVAKPGGPGDSEYAPGVWQDVSTVVDDGTEASVRWYPDAAEGAAFVRDAAESGQYFMGGALPVGAERPSTPPDDGYDGVVHAPGLPVLGRVAAVADRPDDDVDTVKAGSSSGDGLTVASDEIRVGDAAVREYIALCKRAETVAVASAKAVIDIAVSVARGDAPASMFKSVAQQHPGGVTMVRVTDEGDISDYFSGEELDHMAVSDGKVVYDVVNKPPPPGVYVTSDIMLVYTGAAIRAAAERVLDVEHDCPVTCVDGIAGSGKSYHIIHNAKPGDVVLCETRAALADLARELHAVPGWRGHAYTMDGFMMYKPVGEANTLWMDEAFRLHDGKQRAIIRTLKPKGVRCFGDSKQIPVLPYLPGVEFEYARYPYTRVVVKKDTWRSGADVCFCLSHGDYYGYHAVTHLPILRTMSGPQSFVQGAFHARTDGSVVLTYSKAKRDELRAEGVSGVMTIGESQGKTFDHVVLFRDSPLNKALYHDRFQTLVAVTRHRKSFRYVTVCSPAVDDSAVAGLFRRLAGVRDLVLATHLVPGVKSVVDYRAYEAKLAAGGGFSTEPVDSDSGSAYSGASAGDPVPPVSTTAGSEWSLFEGDSDSEGSSDE